MPDPSSAAPVFDDGSDIQIVCESDDPPTSGQWADHEEFFAAPTAAELLEGARLGLTIDIDDDGDNGL